LEIALIIKASLSVLKNSQGLIQELCLQDSQGRVDVTGVRNVDINNQTRVLSEQKITHHAADLPRFTRALFVTHDSRASAQSFPTCQPQTPVAATNNVTER
jgi:hypothetical protein